MASEVTNHTRPTSRNVHAIRVQPGLCTQSSARSIRMEGAASRYGVMRRRTRILCLGGNGYTRIVLAWQLESRGLGHNADNRRSVLSETGLRAWRGSQRPGAEKDDLRLHVLVKATTRCIEDQDILYPIRLPSSGYHLFGPSVRLAGCFLM